MGIMITGPSHHNGLCPTESMHSSMNSLKCEKIKVVLCAVLTFQFQARCTVRILNSSHVAGHVSPMVVNALKGTRNLESVLPGLYNWNHKVIEVLRAASHQHGSEACTVYADRTVCSCRHSKSSAWVRSMYCVCRPYCVQL